MRAARYYGKEDIRIEETEEPTCGPEQVKIAPAFAGICGTDLHEYLGGPGFCPATRHPLTGETNPVTLGHEFSGTVVEVGAGVPASCGLRPGQRAVVRPTLACGACAACALGYPNVCQTGGILGLSGGGGGLSSAVVVPPDLVMPLPDGIGLRVGALVEPLAVAWHAASAAPAGLGPGSFVLVFGGGPIGLALVQCLRAKGVERILVAEPAKSRQEFAGQYGASDLINPITEDVTQAVMKLTGGVGADVVFDCAGLPSTIKTACHAIKTRGTVVNVAIWEKEIAFNPNWLTYREGIYRSVLAYTKSDFEDVIEAIRSGALKSEALITRVIKLDELLDRGLMALIKEKDTQVKILVDMRPDTADTA